MLLVLLVILWMLVGCNIQSGYVVEKQFYPAHTEVEMIDVGIEILIPTDVCYPDKWSVTIRQTGEDNVVRESTIEVTKEEYDSLKEDDWFGKE